MNSYSQKTNHLHLITTLYFSAWLRELYKTSVWTPNIYQYFFPLTLQFANSLQKCLNVLIQQKKTNIDFFQTKKKTLSGIYLDENGKPIHLHVNHAPP